MMKIGIYSQIWTEDGGHINIIVTDSKYHKFSFGPFLTSHVSKFKFEDHLHDFLSVYFNCYTWNHFPSCN